MSKALVPLRAASTRRRFQKDLYAVVLLAADYGWTGVFESNGGIRLFAPRDVDGSEPRSLYVPTGRTGDSNVARTLTRRVHHWSEELGLTRQSMTREAPPSPGAVAARLDPETAKTLAEATERVTFTQSHRPAFAGADEEDTLVLPDEGDDDPVVSEKPYYVGGPRGAEGYESEAIVERTHQSGRTTYRCADIECGFVADTSASVRAHRGSRHGKRRPAEQRRADRAEELLDRVRRLVGTDSDALERRIKELEEENGQLRTRAEAAEEKWQALTELVKGG
jgi:hypothetical protein